MSDIPGRPISRDQPAAEASASDAAGHDEQLRSIIAVVLARRAAGETVDDAALIAEHPYLMPGLGEQLAALSRMHRAAREADTATAGSDERPVHALSFEELDRPIDGGTTSIRQQMTTRLIIPAGARRNLSGFCPWIFPAIDCWRRSVPAARRLSSRRSMRPTAIWWP